MPGTAVSFSFSVDEPEEEAGLGESLKQTGFCTIQLDQDLFSRLSIISFNVVYFVIMSHDINENVSIAVYAFQNSYKLLK